MATEISGKQFIGSKTVFGSAGVLRAVDPALNAEIEPAFGLGTSEDVAAACQLAEQAFDVYRETSLEQRATFIETIATNILELGDILITRAMQETGLPRARLEGERGRTVGQLRLFAKVVRDGYWLSATIDPALPERTPLPRSDLRLRKIAIGPVAVFGASNFPLAFSVAGGDTASAFAAGCPVVVKAHGAHPGTSELVASAIQKAVADCQLPEGVFSMIVGNGNQIGQDLVSNPAIKAVGFTGSRRGGIALMQIAAGRHEPIPVYAEMSSINPVFMLPGVLAANGTKLAQAFVDSLTMGAGQFCTNPGLVIGIDSPDFTQFAEATAAALQAKAASTMLNPGIHNAYNAGVAKLETVSGVSELARGLDNGVGCAARAALFITDGDTFLSTPALLDENFGPSSVLIRAKDAAQLKQIAEYLEGQLTATIHAVAADRAIAASLMPTLERKAGRILFNGFPTGVEVCHAMVHGGPFPSTSDSRTTSVGASAIDRYLRPVCYQDVPADLLPISLVDANPLGLARLVNGELQAT
jgi:2,5-dioxopentanoate dehydrogenase